MGAASLTTTPILSPIYPSQIQRQLGESATRMNFCTPFFSEYLLTIVIVCIIEICFHLSYTCVYLLIVVECVLILMFKRNVLKYASDTFCQQFENV